MDGWIIWTLIALIAVLIEIFTLGFAVICFAFGALAAALASYLGASTLWQLGIFSIFTILAAITVRPMALKWLNRNNEERYVETNIGALAGKHAVVSSEFVDGEGRVSIDGDDWKARMESTTESAAIGERVVVVRSESVILIVKKR